MQIVIRKIEELKPFKKNPYIHDEKQLKRLEKSFKEFGWTNPVLIAQGDLIVAGHARIEVAKRLGILEAPTIFLDFPFEKAVAYVIADNNLAKLAGEDRDLLNELLKDISEIENFDFEATGFDYEELDKLLEKENIEEAAAGEKRQDQRPIGIVEAASARPENIQGDQRDHARQQNRSDT